RAPSDQRPSLYADVSGREELLELVLDELVGRGALPEPDPLRRRQQVHQMTADLHRILCTHRDAALAGTGRIPTSPRVLIAADALTALMLAGGLDGWVVALGIDQLILFVCASAFEQGLLSNSGLSSEEIAAYFAQVHDFYAHLPADRLPADRARDDRPRRRKERRAAVRDRQGRGSSAATGVSKAIFYERFAGKQTCMLAAYEQFLRTLIAAIAPLATDDAPRLTDFVRGVVTRFIEVTGRDLTAARAFFVELDSAGPTARARRRFERQAFIALFAERHRHFCARDPTLAPLPTIACEAIVDAAREIVRDRLDSEPEPDLTELIPDLTLTFTATPSARAPHRTQSRSPPPSRLKPPSHSLALLRRKQRPATPTARARRPRLRATAGHVRLSPGLRGNQQRRGGRKVLSVELGVAFGQLESRAKAAGT
ncbi:MAG: TetR/AcrR family transcriptional regulator, partial [Trebonia sp.]